MKKVTIKIELKGSAFEENPEYEVARILGEIATKVSYGKTDFKVMDINGNSCGSVKIV